jgi:hypothetical protein
MPAPPIIRPLLFAACAHMRELEPNLDLIEIFSDALFRHAGDGWVSLRAFEERDGAKPYFIGGVGVTGHNLKLVNERALQVARNAANHLTPVVFCPPIAIFNDRQKATEANLIEGLALSVECDQRAGEAQRTLEALLGPVTVSVMSGGIWIDANGVAHNKLHLHWRLAVPARGERLKQLKQARDIAARIVGADPSNKPVCHPIRWPGSWHRKAEPVLCEIAVNNPDVEIDLDAALAALRAALPQEQQPKGNGKAGGTSAQHEGWEEEAGASGADWTSAIASIITGESYHAALVSLAAKMTTAGMGDGAAVNMLRGLMDASTAPRDSRWQTRYDDIPRAVETARQKFAGGGTDSQTPQPAPNGDAKISLPFVNMSTWDTEPRPEREWTVFNRIPRRQASLFSGEGGGGKSGIGLHLCAAHSLHCLGFSVIPEPGPVWLGIVPEPGPAIFIDAEDDEREMHYRAGCIADHYKVTFNDMVKGGLHLISFAGKDAVMATASRSGKIEPTKVYHALYEAAGDIKPVMLCIASSANVFAGDENNRPQVQQFAGMLTRIAILTTGSVMLIAHPSLTGINNQSGLSGSTQWHNAFRARFVL